MPPLEGILGISLSLYCIRAPIIDSLRGSSNESRVSEGSRPIRVDHSVPVWVERVAEVEVAGIDHLQLFSATSPWCWTPSS